MGESDADAAEPRSPHLVAPAPSPRESAQSDGGFDIFLSHNSRDKAAVERIAERLRSEGLSPWLDKWFLPGGKTFSPELERALATSRSCGVFIGPHGLGDWAREELNVALDRAAKDPAFRLFAVLIPGAPDPFTPAELPAFLSTRTWVDLRAWPSDPRAFDDLVNAILGLAPRRAEPVAASDVRPYRGLEVFDEQHADFFFGREAETQRVLEKLKETRLVTVVGPSGSGKSSLVRAGVVPALRAGGLSGGERWLIQVLRPGGHPLVALSAAAARLAPERSMQATLDGFIADARSLHLATELVLHDQAPEARLLLVVDQLEELFTFESDPVERRQFLANLLYASKIPGGRFVAVLTLRADFYQRLAAYPDLATHVATHQFLVSPMDADGLRRAIEEPARLVGLRFEQGLIETILDSVSGQTAALPLLEHLLLELWERRRGGFLTLEAYHQSGGLDGALAARADAIYQRFSDTEKEIARRTLLRLTQPGQGTEDTRRRARLDELVTGADIGPVQQVVGALTDARLLTTGTDDQSGEPVVDVAHEALIRGWPRLREWIDDDRAGLLVHHRLRDAAQEWDRLGRDAGLLYRGARLAEALEWRQTNAARLNDLEREFLDTSDAAHRSELEAVRRRNRRLRLLLAAAVLATIAAATAAVFARVEADRADRREREALSRQLAVQAASEAGTRPDRAALLALEALRIDPTVEATSTLVSLLTSQPRLLWVPGPHRRDTGTITATPRGDLIAAVSESGDVLVWETARRRLRHRFHDPRYNRWSTLAFSRDGALLAVGTSSVFADVDVWDLASGKRSLRALPARGGVSALVFLPGNELLGYVSDYRERGEATVVRWRLPKREAAAYRRVPLDDDILNHEATLSPDGLYAAAESQAAAVLLTNLRTGSSRLLGKRPSPRSFEYIDELHFSADGSRLFYVGANGAGQVWDTRSGDFVGAIAASEGRTEAGALSPDGGAVAIARASGEIEVWDAKRRPTFIRAIGRQVDTGDLTFARGRDLVASTGSTGARLWDASKETPLARVLRAHTGDVFAVAFSEKGDRLATAGVGGEIRIWDVRSRRQSRRIEPPAGGTVVALRFGADERTIFVKKYQRGRGDGDIEQRDIESGRTIRTFPGDNGFGAFDMTPDRSLLANVDQGRLTLWAATGARIKTIRGEVDDSAFSPDGERLAYSADNSIVVWDVKAQRPESSLAIPRPTHVPEQFVVAFSPDGRLLAAGGDRRILLWDVSRSEVVGELVASGYVGSIAFVADASALVASGGSYAGNYRTVDIWDLESRRQIASLAGHDNDVLGLASSPTGEFIASASRDYTAILWPRIFWSGEVKRWLTRICPIAGRTLTRAEWDEVLPNRPYRPACRT